MNLRIAAIDENIFEALVEMELKPGQERFVAPVLYSLAEAYISPTAWPRAIMDGDTVVGFLMVNFDSREAVPASRCYVWRMSVAAEAQGRGVGRFAIEAIAEEARRRGMREMSVSWGPGPDGPEGFYLRCGFRKTGEMMDDEIIGERSTDPWPPPWQVELQNAEAAA